MPYSPSPSPNEKKRSNSEEFSPKCLSISFQCFPLIVLTHKSFVFVWEKKTSGEPAVMGWRREALEKNRVFFQITGVCATLQCSAQIMNYTVFHCVTLHNPMKCINGHWSEWKYCATMQSSTSVQWAEMVCSGLGCFKFIALLLFHWLHYTDCITLFSFQWLYCTAFIPLVTLHFSPCIALLKMHCTACLWIAMHWKIALRAHRQWRFLLFSWTAGLSFRSNLDFIF